MLIFLMAQYVHGRREPSVNRCIDPPPQIKIILAVSPIPTIDMLSSKLKWTRPHMSQ